MALGLLASGCIPLPAPTFETAPRFSVEQITAIAQKPQTRQSVEATLGPPDLRRDADRLWIYTWTDDYGSWELVPIQGRWSDNRAGPVESHRYLWLITFDDDAAMTAQEYLQDVKTRKSGAVCSPSDVCISNGQWVDDAEFGVRFRFDDIRSAVTIPGGAQSRRPPLEPAPNQCVLTLWPDAVWDSQPDWNSDEGGLTVRIEGAGPWALWRWLPSRTYAQMLLESGDHLLAVRHSAENELKERTSGGTVRCAPGQRLYIALGGSTTTRDHAPVELHPIDPTDAWTVIADMAQVLPPD